MANDEAQHLLEAVKLAVRMRDATVETLAAEHLNNALGVDQCRKILNDPSKILKATPRIKDAFLDFRRRNISIETDPRAGLYGSIASLFGAPRLSPQSEAYIGRFIFHRRARRVDEFVGGTIEILKADGIHYEFVQRCVQDVGNGKGDELFEHKGPVYFLPSRIYLLGAGTDVYGAYIQLIILNHVDNPMKEALGGVLLTENWRHVPFATKILLMHYDYEAELREQYTDAQFNQYVERRLVNDSELSPHFVHGEGSNHGIIKPRNIFPNDPPLEGTPQ